MSGTAARTNQPADSHGVPGSVAPAGLFVRKSSGLVRELGPRDAMSIAFSGVGPAVSVVIFFVYFSYSSNSDLTWPYLVVGFLMLPLTLVYAQLVAAIPRSGGDFLYISRVFHPMVGAAMGVGFLIFVLWQMGLNAVGLGENALPEVARSAAKRSIHMHSPFSGTLTTQSATFIVGAVVVIFSCILGVFGAKALTRAMFWFFVAAILAVLVMAVESLTHSAADFRAAYNHATAPGAYQKVLAATQAAHLSTGSTFSGFVKFIPYSLLGVAGFTFANYPAGELKRAAKTYMWPTLIGLFGSCLIVIIAWLAVKHLTGEAFIQSAAALKASNPTLFASITHSAPTYTQFYTDVMGGPVTQLITSIGLSLGILMYPLVVVLVASRLMFGLSFDRLLPSKLADVNPKTHAPTKAIWLTLIVSLVFVYLTVYSTTFIDMTRNSAVVWCFVYLVASLAGLALPLRRRDLFAAAPKVVNQSWFGVPAIAVIAGLSTVIMAVLLFVTATNNGLSGGYDTTSIVTLVVLATAGFVVYAISRTYLKRVMHIMAISRCASSARVVSSVFRRSKANGGQQSGSRGGAFRVFFATDIHGSDRCFRKFLAAANVYEADALILGGDIAGKALVPFVEVRAEHIGTSFMATRILWTATRCGQPRAGWRLRAYTHFCGSRRPTNSARTSISEQRCSKT